MEPSKEAIEAAMIARANAGCIDPDCEGCIKDMLTDAYAVDVEPLERQLADVYKKDSAKTREINILG